MNTPPLDTTAVNTRLLMEQYRISSRTTLKARLNQLGFSSFRIGRESYVYQWQKDILDRQNEWVLQGFPMSTFDPSNLSTDPLDESALAQALNTAPNGLDESALSRQPIQILLIQQPGPNPIAPQEYLARAANQPSFTLHTGQLLEILGYERSPKSPHYYGGFWCERIAPHSQWWRISYAQPSQGKIAGTTESNPNGIRKADCFSG